MIRGTIYLLFFLSLKSTYAQDNFFRQLADSALTLTNQHIVYDPGYYLIDYPDGDIPEGRGVCTDVIIRAYRKLGIDLQKEIHEDIAANFEKYPNKWGLTKPDKNIDHRRVPNLMVFFERYGEMKPITRNGEDYAPGDIIAWDLGGGVTHIGIAINKKSPDGKRCLIVHNIGYGQEVADCLFEFTIIGHYRYRK